MPPSQPADSGCPSSGGSHPSGRAETGQRTRAADNPPHSVLLVKTPSETAVNLAARTLTPMTTKTNTPAIEAIGLRKSYRDQVVLDGIDLHVPEGTIFALLGPNGAGKTTTVPQACPGQRCARDR